jgi:hypothetical protein
MSRLSQLFVVAALVVSIGLHWAVLQSAAWVGMAVAYTVEKGSLSEGLSDTFDGDHPCPLCKAVKLAQETEKKSPDGPKPPSKNKEMKLTLALVSTPRFVFPPGVAPKAWITTSDASLSRHERPVTPPPRLGC